MKFITLLLCSLAAMALALSSCAKKNQTAPTTAPTPGYVEYGK